MKIIILGAGIAGVASAYYLKDTFKDIKIYEAGSTVGGLARSFKWHGFDCDIGPHRLYTENDSLLKQLQALVPLQKVRRKTRIFVQRKWINDPVNILELLIRFLPAKSLKILYSYFFRKNYPADNCENACLSKFGGELNNLLFKPYAEKLFGITTDKISATWLKRKLKVGKLNWLLGKKSRLYFKSFYYPRSGGYGSIANAMSKPIEDLIRFNTKMAGITRLAGNGGYRCEFLHNGEVTTEECDLVISTLPLPVMASMLGEQITLNFRSALFIYLLVSKPYVTGNQWVYIIDKNYIINRITEFKNFGTETLPTDKTVICCEVTEINSFSQKKLIEDLVAIGLLTEAEIADSHTIHIQNAYPVLDMDYDRQASAIKKLFSTHPEILHLGRHGEFSHKDADEIIEDAMQLAKKICAGYPIGGFQ